MQAIQCRFISATNTLGYRIKAFCAAGSITIDQPNNLAGQAACRIAAKALIKKLGWEYNPEKPVKAHLAPWVGGCLKNGDYVFVCINESAKD